MNTLRNKLIRLAHANPELRKDILPLITAADKDYIFYVEDEEGSMVAFAGPISKSTAKSKSSKATKDPKWDDHEISYGPIGNTFEAFKSTGHPWFSNLPGKDKKALEKVLKTVHGGKEAGYALDVDDKQITQAVLQVLKTNHSQPSRKDEDDLTKALTQLIAGHGSSVRDPRALAQDLLYQVNIKAQYSTANPNKTRDILDRYVIPASK